MSRQPEHSAGAMPETGADPPASRRSGLGWSDLGVAALVGAAFTASPLTGAARLGPSLVGGGIAAAGVLAFRSRRPAPAHPGLLAAVPPLGWVVVALTALVLAPSARDLFDWYGESIWRNAHGMMLPLVIAGLAARALRRSAGAPLDATAWGVLPLAAGLGLLVADAGVRTLQLSSLGISLLLLGLSLSLLGVTRTRALGLPLVLTLFLLPLPTSLASYLELQSSSLAGTEAVLETLGLPVMLSGTRLVLAENEYAISANCSGFSALYAGVAAALVLGVQARSWSRGIALLLAVWPLVVLFNSLRSAALVLVCERFGSHLLNSPLHGISGILAVFGVLISLGLLAGPRALRNTFS